MSKASISLSRRDIDILRCASVGNGVKATAIELGLSTETIKYYRIRVVRKMGARSLTHAVAIAVQRKDIEVSV